MFSDKFETVFILLSIFFSHSGKLEIEKNRYRYLLNRYRLCWCC